MDRELFLKMEFFQYMIANTDWSLSNKHNLELVKVPARDKVIALPYDFDYSGFVGQIMFDKIAHLVPLALHEYIFFIFSWENTTFS